MWNRRVNKWIKTWNRKVNKKIKSNRNLVTYSIMKIQVPSQTDSELGTRHITLKFVSKLGNGRNMNFWKLDKQNNLQLVSLI